MSVSKSVASSGAALRALVLLQQYTGELSAAAAGCVGPPLMPHADVDLLRLIGDSGTVSPSQMVVRLGRPRSSLARATARLRDENLLQREVADQDARRAQVRLSRSGRRLVAKLNTAIGNAMVENATTARDILLLFNHAPSASADITSAPLSTWATLASALTALDRDAAAQVRSFGLADSSDRAAMLFLADRANARPTQLAHHLRLSPAGTTSLLNRLANDGLLVRQDGSPDDKRAVVLRLTPRGRAATRRYLLALGAHQEAILDALVLARSESAVDPSQTA